MFNNLLIRTLSGLIFIVIMVTALLFHPISYGLLMMLIMGIMTFEYLRITLNNKHILAQIVTLTAGWFLFLLFYAHKRYQLNTHWFLLMVVPILTLWISLLYQKRVKSYAKAPYLFIPLLYITLPLSLTTLLVFEPSGDFDGKALLTLFIILWASDVGAYLFGMSLGQKNGHKLFPSLSPKKSWEGFFGGLITALIVSFVFYRIGWIPYPLIHCLILSTLLHIFGVWGDLAESQLKRHFNKKDSGSIMPGHGGLLDRFDSALFALPISITYIKLLETLT